MPPTTKIARYLPALALIAGLGAVSALAVVLSASETVLRRGFAAALAESASAPAGKQRSAGNGYLRLSRDDTSLPLGWPSPVAVGDRLTIAARDGRRHELEVVEIAEIGATVTRVEQAGEPRLLMVVCKVLDAPEARSVRFIVEADDSAGSFTAVRS
ncbi:MAG: hypothetical protein ACREC6_07410 [Hyphomicrobiaceae bacterium]